MRVVSLVPSLTQTLFDLGLTTDEVVGRTPWCIHPKDKVEQVMIVGGTKTPNLNKIRNLEPDLIVMDKEENPLEIYQTLQNEGFKSGEDITSLNSAAVIYVSDLETSFEKAFETAIDVLKSGSGLDKLKELATFSNNFNESA